MADFWKLVAVCLTVIGWVLIPVITFLANKIMAKVSAYLVDDGTSGKLRELEFRTVPDLEQTLRDIEEKSKRIAAEDDTFKSLERLYKMRKALQSALYEAEDILDLVDYHRIEKDVRTAGKRHGSIWVKQLRDATRSLPSCFRQPVTQLKEVIGIILLFLLVCMVAAITILRRFVGAIQSLCRRFMGAIQAQYRRFRAAIRWRSSAEARSAPVYSAADQAASPSSIEINILEAVSTPVSEPISIADDIMLSTAKCLHWLQFRSMDISIWSRPMLSRLTNAVAWVRFFWDWLTKVIAIASSYRDWSYEEVGFNNKQEDDTELDTFLLAINRKWLRERIEHIKNIVTDSKNSVEAEMQSSSNQPAINDTNKERSSTVSEREKESSSKPEDIVDFHEPLEQWKVFGRDKERDDICRMFRDVPDPNGPSSSSSKRYSVIGIFGVAGSGKTTLAQYVRDYEIDQGNHFDLVMSTRVTTSFRLDAIFGDMLEQMTKQRPSDQKSRHDLQEELKKNLTDRRFLLVLDDVWVDMKEHRIDLQRLNAVLNYGTSGSGVLVTAQNEMATRALGAEKPIRISKMEKGHYFSMFMYYALHGSSITEDEEHIVTGRKIVKKLGGLPIAAVIVAAQLSTDTNINSWKKIAKEDMFNDTMGALKWTYQRLRAGVRLCFEYCSIFPKGFILKRDDLVRMWIAQGFVRKRNATDDIYELGQKYFDELQAFSFLEVVQRTYDDDKYCTMHDLLHKLSQTVAGNDFFFRYENAGNDFFRYENGSPNDIPREVRHLRIKTDNFAGIAEKILQLGNQLRTLIIEECVLISMIYEEYDTAFHKETSQYGLVNNLVKEIFFRNMFTTLRKVRVLIVKIHCYRELELSVPASIGEMKHLRYLSLLSTNWINGGLKLIFPCTISKLYHMQTLDIPKCILSCAEDIADLKHLRHFFGCHNFPNIVMPVSLETIPRFKARTEQGYKLKQLEHLNKLRTLQIDGLRFVTSKEEALEANLARKNQLNELELEFYSHGSDCNPDVQAAVLEGLRPSKDLVHLNIRNYSGSSYPSWMLYPSWSDQNSGGPTELYSLELLRCSPLVSIPEGSEFFIRLHKLCFSRCRWSRLPDNMERLESLQELTIDLCGGIKCLAMLPRSLKLIKITGKTELWKTCQLQGHENWQKIKRIPKKEFPVETDDFLY